MANTFFVLVVCIFQKAVESGVLLKSHHNCIFENVLVIYKHAKFSPQSTCLAMPYADVELWYVQGGPKMSQLVLVRTSSNLH